MTNTSAPSTPALNGQVIGQTERATRAVLDARLAETGTSFQNWVLIRLIATTGATIEHARLVAQMADGLKIDPAAVQDTLDEVVALELAIAAGDVVALTQTGVDLYERIAGAIAAITARLYGDLPADDLETTRRVLTIITQRANAELVVPTR